jgi:hypothetical protein
VLAWAQGRSSTDLIRRHRFWGLLRHILLLLLSPAAPTAPTNSVEGFPGNPSVGAPAYPTASWNQADLVNTLNTMTMQQPDANLYMDSGASSHHSSTSGNVSSINSSLPSNSNIIIGNGTCLPICSDVP